MQNILGQWLYSFKHYLLMCLFLSSPARLPYSHHAILLTGFVYFLLGLLLVDADNSYPEICAQIIIELSLLGLIAWTMLNSKQALERMLQTFSALLGTTVVFAMLIIPIYRSATTDGIIESDGLTILILGIQFWNLAVISLIFKRAFDISTQQSAIIAFGFYIVYNSVFFWLFT